MSNPNSFKLLFFWTKVNILIYLGKLFFSKLFILFNTWLRNKNTSRLCNEGVLQTCGLFYGTLGQHRDTVHPLCTSLVHSMPVNCGRVPVYQMIFNVHYNRVPFTYLLCNCQTSTFRKLSSLFVLKSMAWKLSIRKTYFKRIRN